MGCKRSVLEAFRIPSGSTYPALEVGDHIFVSKVAYGWFHKTMPARGDTVVFRYPYASSDEAPQDFIKRVVALPGDELELDKGHPIINGWRVPSCALGKQAVDRSYAASGTMDLFVEFLDGRAYLVGIEETVPEHEGPFVVWPNEMYVLGDNRANSMDSRAFRSGKGGRVPLGDVKGRAWFVWWPMPRLGISLESDPTAPRLKPPVDEALSSCLSKRPTLEATRPPPPKPK